MNTMNTLILRIVMAFGCCAVWCWDGVSAMAQVRGTLSGTLSTVGQMHILGRGQNYYFRQGAGGGGGLQSTGGGYQSRGVLRSSMSNASQSGRGLRSSIGAGGGAALRSRIGGSSGGLIGGSSGGGGHVARLALASGRKGRRIDSAASFTLDSAGGKGMISAVLGQNTSLIAARGFIASLGESSSLQKSDELVKTLVPDQPGQYRDKMHKGEELLKAGNFISAYEQFKVASDIVGRSPEPYLSMAHARFGASSYGMTAFYIRRAFTYMPELPLVSLRPKNFYENIAIFGDMIIRLETHLEEYPANGDALLVFAYFRWFTDTPDIPAVRAALKKALAVSRSENRTEAIHIFWRAILKSGKATGKLETGATTKPSGAGGSSTPPADGTTKSDKAPRTIQPAKTSNTAGKQDQ